MFDKPPPADMLARIAKDTQTQTAAYTGDFASSSAS